MVKLLFRLIFSLFIILPTLCYAKEVRITQQVIKVADDGLIYMENGEIVELAETIIPKTSTQASTNFIKNKIENKTAYIEYATNKKNRYGRRTAFIFDTENKLLQTVLLENGLAQYYSTISDNPMNNSLILAESTAINNSLGLWKQEKVITSGEAETAPEKYRNEFKIVEGKVVGVKQVKDKLYLNFGNDWKTDFTAVIRRENLKNFGELNFQSLTGQNVRVRGWMELYNGPAMEIYSGGNLQLL